MTGMDRLLRDIFHGSEAQMLTRGYNQDPWAVRVHLGMTTTDVRLLNTGHEVFVFGDGSGVVVTDRGWEVAQRNGIGQWVADGWVYGSDS